MGTFIEFIRKFCLERYLSMRLILTLDLVVSTAASVCTVVLLEFLRGRELVMADKGLWLLLALAAAAVAFLTVKTYRAIIRHSTLRDIGRLTMAVGCKVAVMGVAAFVFQGMVVSPKWVFGLLLVDFLATLSGLVLMRVGLLMVYDLAKERLKIRQGDSNVLVFGTDQKAVALAMRFRDSSHYRIEGFLKSGERLKNARLAELRIYYFIEPSDIVRVVHRLGIDAIIFPTVESIHGDEMHLLPILAANNVKALVVPPLDEIQEGKARNTADAVREVKIEDLLERKEIKLSMEEIIDNFRDRTVLVTGAAGSIGSELCRQLATFGVRHLVLFDNAETPMHNLRLELEGKYPALAFTPVIGDVRNPERLDYVFRTFRPQFVFHAAAYKHVPLMEENPCEAVRVNVAGSRNVADKCVEYGVEKMVMVSTDKAVNPTNIMGCTKRLAEIYVQSLGLAIERGTQQGRTQFVTTRFGNVLGSNGSVIPRFREQIAQGGPVTVTHPDITRFFMTIPEACRLVMEAATMATGTQIFVFDMGESVKIDHLARRMIELAGLVPDRDVRIEYCGLRPGEKLYEEVLSNAENTLPIEHDRIRIAKVREYGYADAVEVTAELERLAQDVSIPDMVRLMKKTVPEFISKNSVYEEFDRETEDNH